MSLHATHFCLSFFLLARIQQFNNENNNFTFLFIYLYIYLYRIKLKLSVWLFLFERFATFESHEFTYFGVLLVQEVDDARLWLHQEFLVIQTRFTVVYFGRLWLGLCRTGALRIDPFADSFGFHADYVLSYLATDFERLEFYF